MKTQYNKIMYKYEFCGMLSLKLGIKKETLRVYFETDNIPNRHKEVVSKALDLRFKADEKIRQIEVNCFSEL
jgi:hypothetical protein